MIRLVVVEGLQTGGAVVARRAGRQHVVLHAVHGLPLRTDKTHGRPLHPLPLMSLPSPHRGNHHRELRLGERRTAHEREVGAARGGPAGIQEEVEEGEAHFAVARLGGVHQEEEVVVLEANGERGDGGGGGVGAGQLGVQEGGTRIEGMGEGDNCWCSQARRLCGMAESPFGV